MDAKIIDLQAWKAAHPPALICWRHGIACALAWHRLWMTVVFRQRL
jgi:hypothetical protein